MDMQPRWFQYAADFHKDFRWRVHDFLLEVKAKGVPYWCSESGGGGKTSDSLFRMEIPEDVVVEKSYPSAFYHTNLTDRLSDCNISGLVVIGTCAHYCVLQNIKGARRRKLDVAVLPELVEKTSNENGDYLSKYKELGANIMSSYGELWDYMVSRNR